MYTPMAKIEVNVTCENCGKTLLQEASHFNRDEVARIKVQIKQKGWVYDDLYGNLCPDCRYVARIHHYPQRARRMVAAGY